MEKWKVLRPLDRMGHGDGWPLLKERPGGCSALRGEFLDEENYENLLFAHSHFFVFVSAHITFIPLLLELQSHPGSHFSP